MLTALALSGLACTLSVKDPAPRPATLAPRTETPTESAGSSGTNIDPLPVNGEIDPAAEETLRTLENAVVPGADLRELAALYEDKPNIPETLPDPNAPYSAGARKTFWVSNVDTNRNFQVDAVLRAVRPHVYFWVQDGVEYDPSDLEKLVSEFEDKIYPTNRAFFGSEWSPGVDGDEHLYVLYARGLGSNLAGYFSSADEVHPLAHEYSNAHEMFLLNADNVGLNEEFTLGVLAHEFQHMIHWYGDRNESSWLNEGFSELAAFLNGYDAGGFDYVYMMDPDLQLNDWPNDPSATTPHYGASFLFVTYFLDRFGPEATQMLVFEQQNGMDSVDKVLAEIGARDGDGSPLTADDVFADWVAANYLHDSSIADGRYAYSNYPYGPQADDTEVVGDCPVVGETRTVSQYGVDYIRLRCPGDYTLEFEGATSAQVTPEGAHSGKYAFWSNKGDESNMSLQREFDLTAVSGPVTLDYWTWYDLEKDYDYLFLLASTDGVDWEIVNTPSCTTEDPSGNSYGCGYNGESGGWIQESVDLSRYAGQKVTLRFDYVTDAAVNGEGLLLDDIAVPAIGYASDFEQDDGGWQAAGFVRIQNALPQTFRVSIVRMGDDPQVEKYALQPGEKLSLPVSVRGGQDVVLMVSGTARFTRLPATYRFTIQ